MKYLYSILIILLVSFNLTSQEVTKTNYLDSEGKITTKPDKAFFIETTEKRDSVWEFKRYNRVGNLLYYGLYADEELNHPFGMHRTFFKNGIETEEVSFDKSSRKNGAYKKWFYDGKKDCLGYYENNHKAGMWKYFHRNGNIAATEYFQNGELIKTILFDETGQEIEKQDITAFQKAEFVKGKKELDRKIKWLHKYVDFHVNGYIYLDFIVDETGNMINLSTVGSDIPEDLMRQFRAYLENKSDWNPAISMNRKVPSYFYYGLKF